MSDMAQVYAHKIHLICPEIFSFTDLVEARNCSGASGRTTSGQCLKRTCGTSLLPAFLTLLSAPPLADSRGQDVDVPRACAVAGRPARAHPRRRRPAQGAHLKVRDARPPPHRARLLHPGPLPLPRPSTPLPAVDPQTLTPALARAQNGEDDPARAPPLAQLVADGILRGLDEEEATSAARR